MFKYVINEDIQETSIELFIKYFKVNKSIIHNIKTNDLLRVNKRKVNFDYILSKGDLVEIDYPDDNDIIRWNHHVVVLYEDEHLLAIYKPQQMLVHGDGNSEKTLTNAVSFYSKGSYKPRHIHRLDYDTSGLVLYTKNIFVHAKLSNDMELGLIEKKYVALLKGVLRENNGTLCLPIGRDRHNNKYIVNSKGKQSISEFEVLQRWANKTLVSINIKTGRTHQIRVHFSHIGHPVIGDKIYGDGGEYMYLFAEQISFIHPLKKEETVITAPRPKEYYHG